MPSVGPNFSIDEYRSATHLPDLVWDTFRAHPCDANIMYPHAEKSKERERMGESTTGLWITCTTSQTFATPILDFVLSCTEGPLGSYPIFLFTTIPKSEQNSDYSFRRIRCLAQRLARIVPPERVFSVFAPDQVTRTFASAWTEETGVRIDSDPIYYAAKISYCTRRSLRHKGYTLLSGVDYDLRLARDEDLAACAELCRGFAEESVSVLEMSRDISLIAGSTGTLRSLFGERLAGSSIIDFQAPAMGARNPVPWQSTGNCVYRRSDEGERHRRRDHESVHESGVETEGVCRATYSPSLQTVCSLSIHALNQGLTTFRSLLKNKDRVVLYVAHNNPAAAKVYDRVGFVGLAPTSGPVEGVDSWLELGFDRQHVKLGHW